MHRHIAGLIVSVCWATSSYAGPIVQDVGTGDFYERVDLNGVTWLDARDMAAAKSHLGLVGHLATITSQAETDFLLANLPVTGLGQPTEFWLGGFQNTSSPSFSEPGGGWEWITAEALAYTN